MVPFRLGKPAPLFFTNELLRIIIHAMRRIDLESLEIFRTVAREGGIVRAAKRLNRVQSNVSTRIRNLEQRLNTELFRRQGRGITLTAAGQALLVHANRLLTIADQAEADMKAALSALPFRIGAMESTAGARLPAILARFHEESPTAPIELQTGTTVSLVRKVLDYELDMAFVGEPFLNTALSTRVVFEERLVLISASNQAPVTKPSDICGRTLLAFSKGCSYRTRLEEWLATDAVPPGRILELSSYHAIIAAAAAGAGYGIVPASLLDTFSTIQNIETHELPDWVAVNRTHLVWKDSDTPHIKTLLHLLSQNGCKLSNRAKPNSDS